MRTVKALSGDDRRTLANELQKLKSFLSRRAGMPHEPTFMIVDADGNRMDIGQPTAMAILRAIALVDLKEGSVRRTSRGFTPRQVGDFLEISRPTVMRYINRGELKASKVNTHFRISPEAVEEFASKRGERRQALDRIAAISEEYGF